MNITEMQNWLTQAIQPNQTTAALAILSIIGTGLLGIFPFINKIIDFKDSLRKRKVKQLAELGNACDSDSELHKFYKDLMAIETFKLSLNLPSCFSLSPEEMRDIMGLYTTGEFSLHDLQSAIVYLKSKGEKKFSKLRFEGWRLLGSAICLTIALTLTFIPQLFLLSLIERSVKQNLLLYGFSLLYGTLIGVQCRVAGPAIRALRAKRSISKLFKSRDKKSPKLEVSLLRQEQKPLSA